MLKKKVLFFTGSRADYGILKPLIVELKKKNSLEVKLAAAGQHFSKTFGYTHKHISRDGIKINYKSKIKLENTDLKNIINYLSISLKDYHNILKKNKPSLVIILGDRYEVFCFAIVAYLSGINLAHLHGGELTYGAFDDGLRHSISKLSDYHFVAHENYRKRVIQLGEDPKKVFCVGALAMDNIYGLKLYSKDTLLKKYKIKTNKKLALVTFHPVTKNNLNYNNQIKQFLNALRSVNDFYYIFTYNNSDTLGKNYIKNLNNFVKNNKDSKLFTTMGTKVYLSFVKNSDVMVGNSSSGIYEGPALKTITLNVGNRQEGRIFGDSIINSKNETKEIVKKLKNIYNEKYKVKFKNIYYKKNIAKLISTKIVKLLKKKNDKKKFYDIKF